jgi:Xaa-Pro aminopeptidase
VRLCEVDAAARKVIKEAGLPVYGHGTGHGVGLMVHESPFISATDHKGKLQAGQVVTIEPGIYLPGKLGVRLEDDVLVTKQGSRVLSRDKRFGIKADRVPLL